MLDLGFQFILGVAEGLAVEAGGDVDDLAVLVHPEGDGQNGNVVEVGLLHL